MRRKFPKDLREVAFNAALGGPAQGPSLPPGTPLQPPPPPVDSSDGVGKIAAKLELDVAKVGLVFDVDEDGLHLTVKRDLLSDQIKVAQQEVAFLTVAGETALGNEWTPLKVVSEAAEDRGVRDTNFAKWVGQLDGDGLRFKGKPKSREVKINAVGFSKAAEIVKRLTDES